MRTINRKWLGSKLHPIIIKAKNTSERPGIRARLGVTDRSDVFSTRTCSEPNGGAGGRNPKARLTYTAGASNAPKAQNQRLSNLNRPVNTEKQLGMCAESDSDWRKQRLA